MIRVLRGTKRLLALMSSRKGRVLLRDVRRLRTSGLIEPAWYLGRYPDVAQSGIGATGHYLGNALTDRRDPSPHFWTDRYLTHYPELRMSGENPLLHFLRQVEAARTPAPLELRGALENQPSTLHTGRGAAFLARGWCYATQGRVKTLRIGLGDTAQSVAAHGRARPDVAERELERDPEGHALFSGFSAIVAIPPVTEPRDVPLTLRATLADGRVVECALGVLSLRPGTGARPLAATWPDEGPRVCICMATYAPPLHLFEAQIASIREQTHRNWLCVVVDDNSPAYIVERMRCILGDDPRFVFRPHDRQAGFYGNFERALALCPADADFVALSDQDDRWYPDKLATLVAAIDAEEVQLATADVRVVDEDGAVRSDTFWVTRRNNTTSIAAMMAANTLIGAASLFRRSLLDEVLPFPERLGGAYHDHWIALSALAKGRIAFVDRPLHAYVQHGGNVIGHKHDRDAPGLVASAREALRAVKAGEPFAETVRRLLDDALEKEQGLVAQKALLARVLLMRHPAMRRDKRDTLRRFLRSGRLGSAIRERMLAAIENRPTLNQEGLLLRSVFIAAARRGYHRLRREHLLRRVRHKRKERAVRNFMAANRRDAPISFAPPDEGRTQPAMRFGHIWWIFHNVAPLFLRSSSRHPRHVNVLLATINFDYLFGGYLGMFNLALRLKREGHPVRFVLLEETRFDLAEWRAKIRKYPGLTTLFEEIEVLYRYDRSIPLDVHPDDRFVATSGWNAHVAHKAARDLGSERFLFMIQDYEPFFGPMNTNTALLRQAYDFPQFGLFSTELLRDYFAENRIGLFATPDGDGRSAVFRNAIQRFAPTRETLTRSSRSILFYARPEEHAARNMFEMGIAALSTLFNDADRPMGWTVRGVGSISVDDRLELAPGIVLEMIPKMSLGDYAAMLPGFDVGLSLMLTPHPSLVPLEMASAGLRTVTNTFANKTAARLRAISGNLIGSAPTLEGIVAGLREAIAGADDIDARLAGARTDWPTDWGEAFGSDTMRKVNAFLAGG